MILVVLDEAEAELIEAIARYESLERGLGRGFRDEISSSLAWIQIIPRFYGFVLKAIAGLICALFLITFPSSSGKTRCGFLPLRMHGGGRSTGFAADSKIDR